MQSIYSITPAIWALNQLKCCVKNTRIKKGFNSSNTRLSQKFFNTLLTRDKIRRFWMDIFTEIIEVTNSTGLWDANFAWFSLSTTHQISFFGLESSRRITLLCFCLIVEVLAVHVKFLQLSGYSSAINNPFTVCTTNILIWFHSVYGPVQTRSTCLFVRLSNPKRTKANSQRISSPATVILPTATGTSHDLSSFHHVIYVLLTKHLLPNIAKLLTHSSISYTFEPTGNISHEEVERVQYMIVRSISVLMSWVFANESWDRGSIPVWVIPKTQKMVLDAALLNTQHYKVRVKWNNPGNGVTPFPTPWCSSYWKGSLRVILD